METTDGFDQSSSTDLVQSCTSCENYDNECNEYINSDLKYVCDIPAAIQNGIVDKLNGDVISVNNSSNIHVGAKIGKVIVDTFTVVTAANVESTPFKHKRKLIFGIISSLCLFAAIVCIVYFTFFTESELDWYVKRKRWGAKEAKQPCTESEDKKVVEIVLFQTNTEFCYNFHDCSQIVRNIQIEDLTDIYATDIKLNFLIGGDGNVYEGLDWHCKELSRAFLASFILVMDLLIMMQDWDFPHFTTTLHVNLPGFSVATLEWKYAEVHLTGKWFNYGLIFMVMLLDLNMWKNQIFYYPSKFGQYTGPDDKIRTVSDQSLLQTGNRSLWTWEGRSDINETTKLPYYEDDMKMNSRYMAYPLLIKCSAFIPSIIAMSLFVSIVSLYGRFPDDPPQHANRSHGPCHVLNEATEGVSV